MRDLRTTQSAELRATGASIVVQQLNRAQWHSVNPADDSYRSGACSFFEALQDALIWASLVGAGVETRAIDGEREVMMLPGVTA